MTLAQSRKMPGRVTNQKGSNEMEELMAYYQCAIMEMETKFKVLNQQFSIRFERNPIEAIKSRLKSSDAIKQKLIKKQLPFTPEAVEENIKDVAGVRIICSFTEDIYMLAECLLKQDDIELITMKDYIKNPKERGYRSLHLIVRIPIFLRDEKKMMKVEVQLRTIAMDFWASLEHKLRYKKNINPEVTEELAKELGECANLCASLDSRMETLKNKIVKI